MYALSCAVQASLIWSALVLGSLGLLGWVPEGIEGVLVWMLAGLGIPQCVSFVVLYRRPPAERVEGTPRIGSSVALGVVLFGALYNPFSLAVLTAITIGGFPFAWSTIIPIVVLLKTYREFVLGDETG